MLREPETPESAERKAFEKRAEATNLEKRMADGDIGVTQKQLVTAREDADYAERYAEAVRVNAEKAAVTKAQEEAKRLKAEAESSLAELSRGVASNLTKAIDAMATLHNSATEYNRERGLTTARFEGVLPTHLSPDQKPEWFKNESGIGAAFAASFNPLSLEKAVIGLVYEAAGGIANLPQGEADELRGWIHGPVRYEATRLTEQVNRLSDNEDGPGR